MDQRRIASVLELNEKLFKLKKLLKDFSSVAMVEFDRSNGNNIVRIDLEKMKSTRADFYEFTDVEERVTRLSLGIVGNIKKIIELKISEIETEMEAL